MSEKRSSLARTYARSDLAIAWAAYIVQVHHREAVITTGASVTGVQWWRVEPRCAECIAREARCPNQ